MTFSYFRRRWFLTHGLGGRPAAVAVPSVPLHVPQAGRRVHPLPGPLTLSRRGHEVHVLPLLRQNLQVSNALNMKRLDKYFFIIQIKLL